MTQQMWSGAKQNDENFTKLTKNQTKIKIKIENTNIDAI